MPWIEPLDLQTIFINILSESPDVFAAIAMIAIVAMGAYFRMNGIALFMMLGIFIVMFSAYIGGSFLVLLGIFGGLLIAYWVGRLVK